MIRFYLSLLAVAALLNGCSGDASNRQSAPDPAVDQTTEVTDPMVAACEGGTAQSCLIAGDAAERDGGLVRAREMYARGCELDDPRGCALAGGLTAEAGDRGRAMEYFEAGCQMQDGTSCYGKGLVALGYYGGEPSPEAALSAFESGCLADLPDACAAMADLIEAGQGAAPDPQAVAELRTRACEEGHSPSCTRLGLRALRNQTPGVAVELFERACVAELPDPEGCGWYGWTLWSGGDGEEQARGETFLDASCRDESAIGCTFQAVVAASAGDGGRAERLLARACEIDAEQCDALRAQFRVSVKDQ